MVPHPPFLSQHVYRICLFLPIFIYFPPIFRLKWYPILFFCSHVYGFCLFSAHFPPIFCLTFCPYSAGPVLPGIAMAVIYSSRLTLQHSNLRSAISFHLKNSIHHAREQPFSGLFFIGKGWQVCPNHKFSQIQTDSCLHWLCSTHIVLHQAQVIPYLDIVHCWQCLL